MNQKQKLLGYYNYTVILTYIGMLTGFAGIVNAFSGNIFGALICLMVSGFCDMFDGAIASTMTRTDREKSFGIQIDSLSDLICFGVLPAVIVYNLNSSNLFIMALCSVYVLCALIRLAYFNVDEQERQENSSGRREVYYGLPVTLSALFLPLAHGADSLLYRRSIGATSSLVLMSLLFLLPFPLRKPRLAGKILVIMCGILEVGFVVLAFNGV